MAEAPRLMAPPRCPRCRIGSLLRDDDGLTCHACGHSWTPGTPKHLDIPDPRSERSTSRPSRGKGGRTRTVRNLPMDRGR